MLAICFKMIHNKSRKMKRLLQRLLLVDSLFSLVDNKSCLRFGVVLVDLCTGIVGFLIFRQSHVSVSVSNSASVSDSVSVFRFPYFSAIRFSSYSRFIRSRIISNGTQ